MAVSFLNNSSDGLPPCLHPLVSVVIPAFNEGPALAEHLIVLLGSLAESLYEFEVLVIDDGSADNTYDVAQRIAAQYPSVRVFRHTSNKGLGAAVRTGFAAATGSIVVTYDSDMSYSPRIIPELLAELDHSNADLVLASPYMRGGSVSGVPLLRKVLSREANRFLSFATNGRYATITCMVRAYRVEFFRNIDICEDRMEINPELFFKAIKKGARVTEIPAALQWSGERARSHSRINLSRTWKQIGRTLHYGVAHRPAVLLALPGILPGVLPLIVATCVLLHLNIKTIALITLVTMIIQNTSLALFAGQLGAFAHTVVKRRRGWRQVEK
jgi:glycosyltransferase involved in cell wall biosynthesis